MIWRRVEPGRYVSACGAYALQRFYTNAAGEYQTERTRPRSRTWHAFKLDHGVWCSFADAWTLHTAKALAEQEAAQ